MISRDITTCLKQVATFLQIQPEKLTFNEDGICILSKNNSNIKGVFNIINEYLKLSNSSLGGSTHEEKVLVRQWIEYSIVYAASTGGYGSIFNTLNEAFARRTYILGNKLSIGDIVLYYTIQNKMEKLNYLEKEQYVNVCRWFDNLQQNPLIRQSNRIVDFNTIHLANVVHVKH